MTSVLSLAMYIFRGSESFWKIEAALFIQSDIVGNLPSRLSSQWSVARTCTPKRVFPARYLLKKLLTFCLILGLGLTNRFNHRFTLLLSFGVMIVLF